MIFFKWNLRNTNYHKIEGYAPKLQLLAERLVMDGPRLGFLTALDPEWKEYLEACGYIFIEMDRVVKKGESEFPDPCDVLQARIVGE